MNEDNYAETTRKLFKQQINEVEKAIKNMNVALPEIDFSSNKTLGELEEEICTKNKGCHNCKHDKESPLEICDPCLYGYKDNWELAE